MFFLFLTFIGCNHKSNNINPLAKKGVLDLSDWNFKEKGSVELNGEWSFYWKQLLTPLDFKSKSLPEKTGFMKLPGLWEGAVINGTSLSSTGHATYRLTTTIKPTVQMLTLYLRNPLSVCKLWVNGRLVAKSGEPGISKDSEFPQAHIITPQLMETKGNLDIILQVSNYHNVQGGIFIPVLIGRYQQIHKSINKKLLTTALVSGAIFVLSLYHLGLYFVRRSDNTNLYFGLYCLMEAVSTAFGDSGICLMAQLFPDLPWALSINLSLLPHGLTIPFLVMFYHSLFPWCIAKKFELFYQILGGLFIFYILITPTNAFDPVMTIYRILSVTVIPYLFFRFISDLKKGAEGIKFLIPGYAIVGIAALNDFLYDFHVINTTIFGPYATILLVLSYSLLISIRFSKAYYSVINLSFELEEKNTSLVKLNTTLKENLTLKKELALRKETEKELRLIHQRLAYTLGFSNEAILAVNECNEISFCNPSFEAFSGYEVRELLGQSYHLLITEKFRDLILEKQLKIRKNSLKPHGRLANQSIQFITKKQTKIEKEVMFTTLEMDEGCLFILIIPNSVTAFNDSNLEIAPADFIMDLNKNRLRLFSLEESLSSLSGRKLDDDPEIKETLSEIDKNLKTMYRVLNKENSVDKRNLGVVVINLAIDYWVFSTKTPKTTLAEQSKLWSVYFEKDGFARTQTLDKYLNRETLPTTPRWKNIINTADFVLEECRKPSPLREQLKKTLVLLRELI